MKWHPELRTKWVIVVVVDKILVVNVWAPNDRREWEQFFNYIERWPWPDPDALFLTRFNCIQSSHLDGLGGRRSGRLEIPSLTKLLNSLDPEDTTILAGAELEDVVIDPTDYYTYWSTMSARRIDRFYTRKT